MSQAALIPAIVARKSDFSELRRQIHMYPELGFDIAQTAGLVAARLTEWGYEVSTNVGGAGVVGTLRAGINGRSIGIRADMDALPIHENTGLPWSSKIAGQMHACGHDGHTAILLAAAWHLSQTRYFDGTVHLIFQPDEENLCGAKAMIDDGLFTRFPCDVVFGLHNFPGIPVGTALVVPGPLMASSDRFHVRINGKGGHGAMPHLARDPVVAAAAVVTCLQTIVSRHVKPGELGVVTVGKIAAGTSYNVIPATAELFINVRAITVETRAAIERHIREMIDAQCLVHGVTAEITVENLVPVLVNHEKETAFVRDVADEIFGKSSVSSARATGGAGSEDFAWMLRERPGCYIIIGNGEGSWGGCSVHNPGYDFNDEAIPYGASLWVRLVERYLERT
jgi:hippurate hydrolase